MEKTERSKDIEDDIDVDTTSELIAQVWYHHGLFCASHPKLLIFLSAIVVLTCSAPLFTSPGFNVPVTEERITKTSFDYGNETFLPPWFDGKPYVSIAQFVLTAHLSPWMTKIQSHEIMRQILKPSFHVTKIITDFKDKESGKAMSDVCLNVTSDKMIRQRSGLRLQDHQFLPASGCLLLSPANLWNRDLERFSSDKELFDNMYQNYGRPAFNILLKEFIFGMPLKQTGLYPKIQGTGPDNSVRYVITVIMTSYQQSYMDGLTAQLQKIYPVVVEPERNSTKHDNVDQVVHIYYKGDGGSLVELGPISVAYFVVFLYLAFSVAKIEMVKSKWGLAFSAVITVVASLAMARGLSTYFGLVSNLHSSEVFPYLVIMVGVENTLVITKSVVSTPVDLDVKIRVAQGLSKEGKYMMKNLATEMFVIGLGYFTFVPAIQEFCMFALIGLLTDFFLQVFLFSTILSIDIRRMEISDLDRVSIQQQILKRNKTSQLNVNTASLKTSSTFSPTIPRLLPPLPADSIKAPAQCPVIPGKSKRLKLVNFWARTRMVQRACMICAVLYFIYMVFYSVTPSTFRNLTSNQPPDQNAEEEMSLSKVIEKIIAEHDTEVSKNSHVSSTDKQQKREDFPGKGRQDTRRGNKDDSSRNKGAWKGLSKYHWLQLLSYYNTSLLGRYISILPPVHLDFKIDSETLAIKEELMRMPKADPSVSLPVIQEPDPRVMPLNSRDPEYYLNALFCVVLGVIVMIVLFFICKYLNDLQIRPKSRSLTGLENLAEAIPLSLKRHPQNVEHMKCTISSIVSICFSGQIRVWDRTTGECITLINRSGVLPSTRRRRTSKTLLAKHKGNQNVPDKNYTRTKYFKSLENAFLYDDKVNIQNISYPDMSPIYDSANVPTNTSVDESGLHSPSSREEGSKSRTGSVGSCVSDNSGYDFGPYCPNGGSSRIKTWGSSHSLDISCSSEEDYPDHLFSGSDEDLHQNINRAQSKNETRDEGLCRRAAVWCLDSKDDVLATGCSDGYVELWCLSSGRQICLYCENNYGVTNVAFLPDRPQIVVARIDGTLDFLTLLFPAISTINNISPFKRSSPRTSRKNPSYDATTNDFNPVPTHTLPVMCSLTHRVRAHHQPASVMVVTKEKVVTGSHDRTLKVFRTNDGVRIFTLHGHRDGITALKVLESDPSHVISGASNGGVRVWDLTSGECLQHLRGHTCAVTALACTQENIISVSIDNSMCIWDRKKGKCIHYKLKQFPVLCSNIIMMSNNLFVTGGQGCIVLWDLHAGKQVKTIPLDKGDTSILVRNVSICDTATIVCSYGKELRVVTFPSVINKAE